MDLNAVRALLLQLGGQIEHPLELFVAEIQDRQEVLGLQGTCRRSTALTGNSACFFLTGGVMFGTPR
jgi:hypothetical protein